MTDEEKVKKEFSIESFSKELEKISGKGSTHLSINLESYTDVIPFSSINLNNATGIGGLPKNKVIEIIGWESAGKTTISTDIIAQCQKKFGDYCLLIDRENSFDPVYAETLNVDLDKLLINRPEALETCYDVIEKTLETKKFGVIVVDSLTSFRPQAAIDGNNAMGKESRINSDKLRMVTEKVVDSNCCVIFINQIREKIGVMFGSPETTNGGNALKFYSHMRIMIRRKEIKDGYNTMHFKFIKNKMAPPMKESTVRIIWGKGFDLDTEAIELAIQENILRREGNSYFYNDTKIAKSKAELESFWKDNPEVLVEIRNTVRNSVKETLIVEKEETPVEENE